MPLHLEGSPGMQQTQQVYPVYRIALDSLFHWVNMGQALNIFGIQIMASLVRMAHEVL